MFTGIIEELGEVMGLLRRGELSCLEVKAAVVLEGTKIGDSIAVNGTCLTVTKTNDRSLFFDVMPETLKLTNLGLLKNKGKVNLERALKVGDRISGHFVSGHVDCCGVIRKRGICAGNLVFEVAIPNKFMKHIVLKGSVAIDGISLTVAAKKTSTFSVFIIPHTLKNTTLGFKGPSDRINIEFDMLLKK